MSTVSDTPAVSLQDELDSFLAYAPGGVLLWHDPDGTHAAALGTLALPPDASLVRETNVPRFELLHRVNALAPDETLLLYRRRRHRVEADDWLADVEAYAACFSPDAETTAEGHTPEPSEAVAPAAQETAACEQRPLPTLSGDWYSPADFRAALAAVGVAEGDVGVTAERLGFRVFDDCVLRATWSSPAAYYRTLFGAAIVAQDSLPEPLRDAGSFRTFLAGAMAAGTVLEYGDQDWITPAGLAELDITRDDLDAFVRDAVASSVEAGIPQFTVPWLRSHASGLALLAYDLEDCFYESVLLSRRALASRGHLGGRRIFAEPHAQARGRDLVESLVRSELSWDAEELLDVLRDDYGIPIQRAALVALARKTDLFFSPELDRMYVDHDQFVREVE